MAVGSHSSTHEGSREAMIFLVIIASAIGLAIFAFFYLKLPPLEIFGGAIVLFLAAHFFPQYDIYAEYQRGVLFRLGRFDRVEGPGGSISFPHIDRTVVVDLRTQLLEIPEQEVITKDEIQLKLKALVFYRIRDPRKAVVAVRDYKNAIEQLVYSELRAAVSKIVLDEVIVDTEALETILYKALKERASDWGLEVQKAEIQKITLPEGFAEASLKKKEALEYKEKILTEARARQESLSIMDEVTSKLNDRTLAYLYMDTLRKVSDGKSNKILFPMELTKLASSLSNNLEFAGVKEGKFSAEDRKKIIREIAKAFEEEKK